MTRHIEWPDEDLAIVRQMVADGISAEKIAERLGGRYQPRVIRRKISKLDTPDTRAGKTWTPERVELAGRLWVEGKSATEIAKILGEGVTRSAVIGRVSRMKLAARAPCAMPKIVRGTKVPDKYKKPQPPKVEKPKAPPKAKASSSKLWFPKAPKPEPQMPMDAEARKQALAKINDRAMSAFDADGEIAGVQIADLERHHCRWPIGDGYCGKPRQFMDTQTAPYCAHHRPKAVSPMNPRSPQNGKELYRSLRRLVV
jgi:GcrA cell cycle regulator